MDKTDRELDLYLDSYTVKGADAHLGNALLERINTHRRSERQATRRAYATVLLFAAAMGFWVGTHTWTQAGRAVQTESLYMNQLLFGPAAVQNVLL